MFRRLRGRLDQLQSHANATMSNANFTLGQAQELMKLGEALIEDLQDGVGVTVHVDAAAATTLMGLIVGRPGKLPLSVQIDPTVDTLPSEVCKFVGGSHDGKRYTIANTGNTTIWLEGDDGPEQYDWTGKHFLFTKVSKR